MNIQEYISSGIVESYVLGLASAEERSEFETMCRQYPELEKARTDFELALEKAALQNAIAPPGELKEKIFAAIGGSAKIVRLRPVPRRTTWWKYAAVASFIFLAASLYWNITLYNKSRQIKGDLDHTLAKLSDVENDIRIMEQNPTVKMASMKGMEASPKALATIFWDTTSKDVYLLVNNLPRPASNKQYQLWALLNGKPIDQGLIDNEYFIQQKKLLLHMKNAQDAQAFAITLEEKGGSPTPKGQMYVMGSL